MKKTFIIIVLAFVNSLGYSQSNRSTSSQLEKAFETGKFFFRATPKIEQPYYHTIEETGSLSKNKNGDFVFFSWGAGLYVDYDYDQYDFSVPFKVEGMRNRPTGSTTLTITKQGISIKTYNDVQYKTEFYSNTGDMMKEGTAKKPDDAHTSSLGCKSGRRAGGMSFQIGDKRYKCKANLTCQHNVKRLVVTITSKKYDYKKGKYLYGAGDPGGSTDFISPWKFSHTLTCQISFNDMAQSMGITVDELKKKIISEGFDIIGVNDYTLWTGMFSDIVVYSLAQQLGYTPETINRQEGEEILAKAESYFEKGKSAVKEKQRANAIELLESATSYYKKALDYPFTAEKKQKIWDSYLSALRTQTFNAYRLMKSEGTHADIFQRNYGNLSQLLKKNNSVLFDMFEYGLGTIALEIKEYDDAIHYLQFINSKKDQSLDSSERKAVDEILMCLAKAYIGANRTEEAKEIIEIVLREEPENPDAIECRKQIGM